MRTDELMRFDSIVWRVNPKNLKLEKKRRVTVYSAAEGGCFQDGGQEVPRIVCSGCCFNGSDELEQLEKLMDSGKVRPLYVPGYGLMPAMLEGMCYIGEQGAGKKGYELTFLDMRGAIPSDVCPALWGREYTAAGGESLWDVSALFDADIDLLIELNAHIRHINRLEKGETVWLR